MDETDVASANEEVNRANAIYLASKLCKRPEPTGECLNPKCGELVEPPRLFCNSDCSTEFERQIRRKGRQ